MAIRYLIKNSRWLAKQDVDYYDRDEGGYNVLPRKSIHPCYLSSY